MQTEHLQQLKLDLGNADPTNDLLFHDLLKRSVSLLGISIHEIAKAVGITSSVVEDWVDGYATSIHELRPWIYRYLMKQITHHGELVSYHAIDEYGHRYHFDQVDDSTFHNITAQLAKCSKLLDRMQLSYAPPKMRLSFFVDSTRNEDTSCIEELHYLIAGWGGYAEVHMSGGNNATVIPLSKREREGSRYNFSMSLRHCFNLKDGCHIPIGGRCFCACCLLEKRELIPKVAT